MFNLNIRVLLPSPPEVSCSCGLLVILFISRDFSATFKLCSQNLSLVNVVTTSVISNTENTFELINFHCVKSERLLPSYNDNNNIKLN